MDKRVAFARALRNNATPQERAVWNLLSRCRPRFTRQLRIGPYVADLACRRARLIVEIDGGQHDGSRNDEARTAALEAVGWRVIRFWNSEVDENPAGVAEAVISAVSERLPVSHEVGFAPSRAGRVRKPRKNRKEPPPAPPARAGGET